MLYSRKFDGVELRSRSVVGRWVGCTEGGTVCWVLCCVGND